MLENQLKQKGNTLTCPAIILVKDGKVLVGYRHYTPDKWKKISVWTTPGGRCDDGEPIGTTLRREIAEETGITDFKITEYLGKVPGAHEGDVVPLFLGKTEQAPKLMEPEKFSEWKWAGVDDFPEVFINEHIRKAIFDQFSGKEIQ